MFAELRPRFGSALEFGVHLAAPVVHRVVAAPQDAVVFGEPVVVELVGDIAEPLAVGPAQFVELCPRQRFGDHAVVVDRGDVLAHSLQQRLERVGGQRHLAGADAAEWGFDEHTHAVFLDGGGLGVFVDAHTQRHRGGLQPPHQASRVDDGGAVFAPQPAGVGGRVHLSTHRRSIEPLDFLAHRPQLLVVVAEFIEVRR